MIGACLTSVNSSIEVQKNIAILQLYPSRRQKRMKVYTNSSTPKMSNLPYLALPTLKYYLQRSTACYLQEGNNTPSPHISLPA
mmetsp:Transcript_50031/g.128769  ORF Transcript_50031/g.128769 Transcript_50031/m.128769 type:complete len:83 (+) Transcript_50031:151-399(+)